MSDIVIFSDVSSTLGFGRYAGAYRIATELRSNGFDTQVVDFFAAWSDRELETIISKFVTGETLIVGFASTLFIPKTDNKYSNHIEARKYMGCFPHENDRMLSIFSMIRKRNLNTKIVLGGAKSTFTDMPGIDYFIWGEGENSIVHLAKHLKNQEPITTSYAGSGKKITTVHYPYEKFNTSIIEWAENDLIFEDEHLPIELSRGCRFKCSFCSYNLNGKKPTDYIKSTDVLNYEMKRNYERFGTTGYMFCDDTYNDSLSKVKDMHSLFTNLHFNIEWSTYARVDMIYRYPEMIHLLKESGLRSVYFGIETFNHMTGKNIGKGLDPDKVKETLYKCKEAWGDDVIISSSFIVGLPFESKESIQETVDWLSEDDCPLDNSILIPLNVKKRKESQFNISDISMYYEDYGYEVDDNLMWKNEYMTKQEAIDLVEMYHKGPLNKQRKLAGFTFYSRFRNLGFSTGDCSSMSDTEESMNEIDKRYQNLRQVYFNKLMQL